MSSTGPKPQDHTSKVINKLTVVSYRKGGFWDCLCSCGRSAIMSNKQIVDKSRFGCRSCTAAKVSSKTNEEYEHFGLANRIYKEYKDGAKKRNLEFKLQFKEFFSMIKSDCFYCGQVPENTSGKSYMRKNVPIFKRNGIDRADTSVGYTSSNCVSCCSKCNYAKHEMSVTEFDAWIKKVYDRRFND